MRDAFAAALRARAATRPLLFLTGDLGFMAFEELRATLGERFLNCGVAEQNMVGVAAGLAREGHEVWVYSIAPFLYARALEQIRNDLALPGLPVRLVGNGGGYAYGVMGPTHHALEDLATLSALPGARLWVPCFRGDVAAAVDEAAAHAGLAWLRLGRDLPPGGAEPAPGTGWRCILPGEARVAVALGPLAAACLGAWQDRTVERRPTLWCPGRLPVEAADLPEALVAAVRGRELVVLEDHYRWGGLASQLVLALVERGAAPGSLAVRGAAGYPSGRCGSEAFHLGESGLAREALAALAD